MCQTGTSAAGRPAAGGSGLWPNARRALGAGAVTLTCIGLGACSVSSYPDGRVYLGPQDRIVIRGGTQLRGRELDRYTCEGDMVLMCSVHGSIAECSCSIHGFMH